MNGTLTIGPPGVSTPASVAMRIARSPPSRPKWRETASSGMSTCMRPASISAGTRRGKMNLSIEKPFFAPRSGSPGSFTYATPASASASTTRTIVERSTSGRIAAPFARSAATHYGTRALYTPEDGAAPPQIPRGRVHPERRRRRRRLPGGRHRPTAQRAVRPGDRGDRPVAHVLARPRPGARHDRREGARGHGRRGRAGGLLGRHGARVPRDARDGPALPRVREARRDSRRERPDEPRDPREIGRAHV